MTKLVVVQSDDAERLEQADDRPQVGSWWWVDSRSEERDPDYDRNGRFWLGCVVEIGSNYVKVKGVRLGERIAADEFHDRCSPAHDYQAFVDGKLAEHKGNVRALIGEIQALCHKLGVPYNQALAEAQVAESSTALAAAHAIGDVKRYQKALVKAKEKTLPDLFKQIQAEHERMATWMKAEMIPAEATLATATRVTEVIDQKIHTVELYAGLQEQLELVRDGATAHVDAKVHLMQRRHYMDEECLARYEAGGMNFENIGAFDRWLSRDENMFRIFPHPRCIVAFKIRRYRKDYSELNAWIAMKFAKADEDTFLYIRNGHQLWRMETSIDFDEQLFPNRETDDLLGDEELWIRSSGGLHHEGLITGKKRAEKLQEWREERHAHAHELWAWHRAGKPDGDDDNGGHWTYIDEVGHPHERHGRPHTWIRFHRTNVLEYKLLTPHNVYYDDAMRLIAKAAYEHNRIAMIVQGLLDRSMCLQPHPPWRIWTPEGFAAGIELTYDDSKALAAGEAPSFETYRAELAKSIKVGSYTKGQHKAWRESMIDRYGHQEKYWPASAGRGPGGIARVAKVWRDGSCSFAFSRARSWRNPVWVPSRPGYVKKSYPDIEMTFRCPADYPLFCISAYTPGDFHLFYDDPRTRADYLKWAPFLLAAEDWHAKRRARSEAHDDKAKDPEETDETDEEEAYGADDEA